MKTVLVGHGSRMGSTAEIAEAVGGVLRESGLEVTVLPCSEAPNADKFDAVVIGAAIYLRHWEKSAADYLEQEATRLAGRPTWLFQSGPCGDGAENEVVETPHLILRLVEHLGIQAPVTFGGRLDRAHASGPIRQGSFTSSS